MVDEPPPIINQVNAPATLLICVNEIPADDIVGNNNNNNMDLIKVTVKGVKLFRQENENGIFFDVNLQINEEIDGYKRDENNNYVAAKVTDFSIRRPQFTAEVCNVNEKLAIYRNGRETGFDQKSLGVLFTKSTLEIVRTHHSAGEEVLDSDDNPVKNEKGEVVTYTRDCYTTNIVSVSLSKLAEAMLDKWLDNAL